MSAITKARSGAVRAGRDVLGAFQLRTGPQHRRTGGYLRNPERAWVYVGVARRGAVKIGMTADPARRARSLGVRMALVLEVVPSAAKEVEQEALRMVEAVRRQGEWFGADENAAIRAVRAAFDAVGRRQHVDPAITADQARKNRVALATLEAA